MNINIEDLRVIIKESLEGRFEKTLDYRDKFILTTVEDEEKQFISTTQNLIIGKVIKKSQSYK